ncbi:hypothetical protein WEI85_37425 [Actinomycetes bacterium KLBMP 9797]
MNERERHEIEREARRELFAHPERRGRHEDIVTRFLGAQRYERVSRGQRSGGSGDDPEREDQHLR